MNGWSSTMKAIVVGTLSGAAFAGLIWAGTGGLDSFDWSGEAVAAPTSKAAEVWACPMKEDAYETNKPGRCPKCGMKLIKLAKASAAADSHSGHKVAPGEPAMKASPKSAVKPGKGQKGAWVCPMGHIVTSKPGDCPVCGMKLVKQKVGQAPGEVPAVPGTVMLSAEKQQQIGVRTAEASEVDLATDIRAAGKIDFDESRVSHVHTKIEGWIQDLYVNTTGQTVQKGQPLLTLYSPDLLAAQEEYLQAVRTEQDLARSGLLPKRGGLTAAAGVRLQNWDFGDAEQARLRQTGKAIRGVTLSAHHGGVVLEKKAIAGMRVMPGDELFTIADLSWVWAQAQVYESELDHVKIGATAKVQLAALPGRAFDGRVKFVSPTLDPMTRTAKVRVVLENPGLVLKPEMFATVTLRAPAQRHLAIPSEAVLDSGDRQVAFVAKPGGYFEPRILTLGGYRGDRAIVRHGISRGERVVTSANFLIDSESQLQAAMRAMGGSEGVGHKH
jgi:Cu(I)/Ag(I) efflux system membrane fusion protein